MSSARARAGAEDAETRRRGTGWRMLWPAVLGVLVAGVTAYGLSDPRDVAPVVAASGLVYLAAAATERHAAAWVAFGATFVVIALDKLIDVEATAWVVGIAALVFVYALARRRGGPWWSLPLQTAAMVVLGATALLALRLAPTAGGLVVAAALATHAIWDVIHLRTGRVVGSTFAVFCAVLDILLAAMIGVVAIAA